MVVADPWVLLKEFSATWKQPGPDYRDPVFRLHVRGQDLHSPKQGTRTLRAGFSEGRWAAAEAQRLEQRPLGMQLGKAVS